MPASLDTIMPPDASLEMQQLMRTLYGFDRPLPVQFGLWLGRALAGDLGVSIASGRPVAVEVWIALKNTFMLAALVALVA